MEIEQSLNINKQNKKQASTQEEMKFHLKMVYTFHQGAFLDMRGAKIRHNKATNNKKT